MRAPDAAKLSRQLSSYTASRVSGAGWTRSDDALQTAHMPLIDLTDIELTEAARGARCLAAHARADAERQGRSSTRAIFQRSVEFHEAMARKFEQARKVPQT